MFMKYFKPTLSIILICLFSNLSYTQDWGNLNKFKKENITVMNSENNEERVVFMGNSITEGWLNFRPDFFKDNPYINRGISGQTTPQMLIRFRQDVVKLKPSVVVILAGINDIAENTGPTTIEMIADNIISMSEMARANQIKVIICSVLPAFDFPWRPGLEPAKKVIKLNKLLKGYSKENGLVYANYFSAMVNGVNGLKEELGYDPVHPNESGYIIMEPIIQKAIKESLEK